METMIDAIYASPFATAIRESRHLFPVIESVHVTFICLVVAFIFWVDFRLVWAGYRDLGISTINRVALPIVWCAFGGAVVTGFLLFSSIAPDYMANVYFQAKMVAILLAGLNMAAFHALTHFGVVRIEENAPPPIAARLFGLLSITLWTSVVSLGRYIGFSL